MIVIQWRDEMDFRGCVAFRQVYRQGFRCSKAIRGSSLPHDARITYRPRDFFNKSDANAAGEAKLTPKNQNATDNGKAKLDTRELCYPAPADSADDRCTNCLSTFAGGAGRNPARRSRRSD